MLNRQTKSKGYYSLDHLTKFADFSKNYITRKYKPCSIPYTPETALELARTYVNESKRYTLKQKEALLSSLDHVINKPIAKTVTKCFIKQEVTFGEG